MPSAQSSIGKIWVTGTTLLIAFIAYSSQIFVIFPWYGRELSVDLIYLLGPFNILVGMLYWNYFMTVRTDPGHVPPAWQPEKDLYEAKKLTGQPRYCRTCEAYKPPRTHHCRQCKRCIPRMDHHCPWVDNCVGHYNYAHFIRFLFFVDIACLYHLCMLSSRVFGVYRSAYDNYWIEPTNKELVFIILNYVACVPVILMVGGFSAYHFYCLLTNTTTIEAWEKDKVATLIRRGKIREVKFPYNLGWKENFCSVFGRSPLYWLFPMKVTTDGLAFKVLDSEDGTAQSNWPPNDPYVYEAAEEEEPAQFDLNSSPWTYGNGINPDLRPSNASTRLQARRSKLPPYHPNYNQNGHSDHDPERVSVISSGSSDGAGATWRGPRIRRGSEGWEIGEIDREEILRRYVASSVAEPGRYQHYAPQSDSEVEEDQPLTILSETDLAL